MRKLEWPSYAMDTLRDVVDVLNLINPKGQSVEHIKARVQAAFDNENLTSYIGTAGWYVTVYERQDQPGVWEPKPTLMAYSVKRYLKEIGKL
ncbi:MAG: hypothetical protein EOQ44_25200 [Mesorhizobium sp.]|uniref:hypothetical protein n=1 Tax=Mesorhizobium sp. TaxID=1871066 RepID=UPI000FE8C38F|nr:hypothetical protein [Mesorhizobium sp.]RWB40443.1 MAG: hypothetical protein EOQ44_25200 [Mesorhizobium sp.]